ncbi:MAG: ATP-binding protein, partial [Chloroflexota bacterium]
MPWEELKSMFRPKGVHMGVMEADPDKCTGCGVCILNCPFRAWEMGDDNVPRQKDEYECFSCFNCMVACPVDAISIVQVYHVDEGFFKTLPHPLPVRMPYEPQDANGNPDTWNVIE